jgi:NAD(P)H dehydrogenase (quinone)
MPTITVFGASGRIGRATVMSLAARGAQVRAVTHRRPADPELAQAATVVSADLRDPRAIAAAAAGSDAVQVICPVPPTAADPRRDAESTIEAIAQGLEAATPGSVLVISDYGAEIPTGTGVTTIFYQLEQRLHRLSCALTFLRSAEHMHNWKRQLPATLQTGLLASMHHPLTKIFPTVHAPDVGLIAADLLLSPPTDPGAPRITYAEGPRRYTSLDVAAAIATAVGQNITAQELSRTEWERTLIRGGATPGSAALVAELYDAHNAGRIQVQAGSEVRRGATSLTDALRAALAQHAPRHGDVKDPRASA